MKEVNKVNNEKGIEPKDVVKKPELSKPLEVEIPEKIAKHLKDLDMKSRSLINNFVSVSFQVVELQSRQQDINAKIKKNHEDTDGKMKYAFDKLKLKKKVEYRWSYDTKNLKFIGVLKPKPRPKPEQGKTITEGK